MEKILPHPEAVLPRHGVQGDLRVYEALRSHKKGREQMEKELTIKVKGSVYRKRKFARCLMRDLCRTFKDCKRKNAGSKTQ